MTGSFGSPSWQVESGQRVGAFVLGMGVNQALSIVQSMGCLEKQGMFSFDDRRLFDVDLSLRLPPLGLQLCFDSFRQDLRVICVTLKPDVQESNSGLDTSFASNSNCSSGFVLPLTYVGKPFACNQNSTLREIINMIGPTYLGDFVCEHGEAFYILRYPGLAFEFTLPSHAFSELAERQDHPYEMPLKDGIEQSPPTANRMWVYAKTSSSLTSPASAWLEEPKRVIVRPGVGLELNGKILRFGAMPQDVFSDFGPPDQACVKTMDSVRIHSVSAANQCSCGPDYYYNYFQLGFDVLFDGYTHLAKKMVLHTNPPTHESFSRYSRCFFQIPVAPPACDSCSDLQLACSEMPEFTLEGSLDDALAGDTEAAPFAPACLQDDAVHSMQPSSHEETSFSRFALPFTDDWRTRLESKLAERNVASKEGRLQVQIVDCEGEPISALLEEIELLPERFPLSVSYPRIKQSADLVDEGQGNEDVGSRRMSKRERKSARKKGNQARAPMGSPLLQGESSPDLSLSSPSLSPSPLLAQLASMGPISASTGAHETVACAGDDLDLFCDLPPPAVPIDNDIEDSHPDGLAREEGTDVTPELQQPTEELVSTLQNEPALTPCDLELPETAEKSARMLQTLSEGGCVGVEWAWPEIQELLQGLGISCRKPLVVDKGSQSPFGSSRFYAIPGLVFEVMQNGYLASLTLFSVPLSEIRCERLICRDVL